MSRPARIGLYTLLSCGLLIFWNRAGIAQDPPIPADTEIVTTASGLQYSILKRGTGDDAGRPRMGERVKVHYTGWLTSGKVFDSSRKRGEPAEFRLGEVIEGWNEGLQLMSPGDTFKLTIPPGLGYGEQPQGSIPANSTLIFEVELLGVTRAPAFVPLDPAKTQVTESGLKFQVLQEGEGRLATVDDAVEMTLAFWKQDGTLIDATAVSGSKVTGPLKNMTLPFLKEGPALMKVGSKYLFEVPPALAFGSRPGSPVDADATTIWQLELVRIVEPPVFQMPDDSELTTTASGLKYKMLVEGGGKSPKMYEYVTCNYSGWLTDGKLFDSSVVRGQPSEFMLGQVIQGWNEGLQLMKEGGSAIFVIPAGLAYGKQQKGSIPPDSTLVFRVDLIKVGRDR